MPEKKSGIIFTSLHRHHEIIPIYFPQPLFFAYAHCLVLRPGGTWPLSTNLLFFTLSNLVYSLEPILWGWFINVLQK